MIAALLLRLYDLGEESLWLDEISSATRAQWSMGELIRTITSIGMKPLHEIMLHYWIKLFGSSEFSVRFPSAVFGVACVFLLYRVGALMFNKRTALLSALLVSLSSFHLYYSQEARPYALLAMLTLFSMYFFLRLIREQRLVLLVGYITTSSLMLYCHPYGLFLIIAQNVYVVTTWFTPLASIRLNWKQWILLQFVLCLTFMPWLKFAIMTACRIQTNPTCLPVPAVSDMLHVLKIYSGDSTVLCILFIGLSLLSLKIRLVNTGIKQTESCGRLTFWIDTAELNNIYLLSVWLLIPILVPFVISRISSPIFNDRYTIGASFSFYLFISRGIDNISGRYVRLAVTGIVVVLTLVALLPTYGRVDKERWREVAAYVETHAQPGDLVLFQARFCQVSFDYYASSRKDLIKIGFPQKTPSVPPLTEESIKELPEIIRGHSRIWLILSHSRDTDGLIVKHLSKSYNVTHNADYFFINLYLFERKTTDMD
jgi:uncharacterized membrane protein